MSILGVDSFQRAEAQGHTFKGNPMQSLENIDISEALVKLGDGALLLDVREVDEFEAGHAPQAKNIPLSEVPDHIEYFNKDQVIVCVCRSGGRSARAGQFILEQGFQVFNLEGGMLNWDAEDHEIVSDDESPYIK